MALSGRLRSALIIGAQGIRARKLRTFLSMVSLFLGVLAVVTVQASAEIANRALLADIELQNGKDGSTQVYLPSNPKTYPLVTEAVAGRSDIIGAMTVPAVIGEPNLTPINPNGEPFEYAGRGGGGEVMDCGPDGCRPRDDGERKPGGQAIKFTVTALTGDIRTFRPFRLETGQWLAFGGEPSLSPGLVVNKEMASGLKRYRVPAELAFDGSKTNATPRIIGVVDDGSRSPAAYMRMDELVPWRQVDAGKQNEWGGFDSSMMLYEWPSAAGVDQVLTSKLAANGVRTDEIHRSEVDAKKQIGKQLTVMRLIFLAMAGLVLLIGVAGILNVGLATVGERVEELALRRAVGTPRFLLAGIVLAETLITGVLTAGAAVGAGVVGLQLASKVLGSREPMLQDVDFPWQAGVAGVIAGVVAGVLGGLLPAIRAARIPIATVMRA